MVKHNRWRDKSKSDFSEKENKTELTSKETTISKSSTNAKSIILSGTKYAYIVVAVALFSGIFTPLTLGIEIELVLSGMFTLFLGLGGGIMIFLGIKYQKFTTILICSGLGIMIVSLILILELAGRSLFT
tara:strand:+ start:101 stop:490 length:390 start_codon:yes stop_codon:yes gene_type:complete